MFTAFIISSFIGFIFAAMTICTCFRLSCYSLRNFLMAKIKAAVRHTDRPIDSGTSNSHTIMVDGNLWHDGFCSFISSIVLVLIRLPSMTPTAIQRSSLAIMSQAHIFSIGARLLLRDAVFSCKSMIPRFSRVMRESIYFLRESLKYF
jgi:hypothetical protein